MGSLLYFCFKQQRQFVDKRFAMQLCTYKNKIKLQEVYLARTADIAIRPAQFYLFDTEQLHVE